ncbi:MAG: histidinol-phosphate transaminase [Dehalococcoidia bacterium]|jgi:histidinol-phosphate aminotransferase
MLHAKQHIVALPAGEHGGLNSAGLTGSGKNSGDVLDFSTCCNPYGPPKQLRRAIREINSSLYPDPDSTKLVRALAKKMGINQDNLIAGSGSTEIIRLAAAAYLGPGDSVVMPAPTYGEYELACRIVNSHVIKFILNEKDGFKLNAAEFAAFAKYHKPAGIFLCNPNNPTGQYLSYDHVYMIIQDFPDSLVVLDEAYIAFTGSAWDSLKLLKSPNLLIVRSMTKDFALAGLRLGYGIAQKSIIDALKKVRPPWNVNSPAQQAGLMALSCDDYILSCCERINRCKLYLSGELIKLGLKVIPSQTNFFIFKTGDAAGFKSRLLERGFMVRDCTSFGLPGYIRVSPRSMPDCRKLIAAIREVC